MTSPMLWTFFWTTAIVTAMVGPLVLWRYGQAVLEGMRHQGQALPLRAASAPAHRPAAAGLAGAQDPLPREAWDRVLARRFVLAWTLVFAGVAALALPAIAMPGTLQTPGTWPGYALAFCIPLIATLAVGLGWSAGFVLAVALAVLVAVLGLLGSTLAMLALALDRGVPWSMVGGIVALAAGQLILMTWQALLLMVLCGANRARAVMPLVFAGLLVFALAPMAGAWSLVQLGSSHAGSRWLMELGLGGVEPLFAILALPVAGLAWLALTYMARAYRRKALCELQIQAQAWWSMLVVPLALPMIDHLPAAWVLASAVASIVLFGPIFRRVFALVNPARGALPSRSLLVLRVFGWRSRSQRLFDRVIARWRLHGPVTLIAAPDVVARTIDAVDFVEWLVGRTHQAFVRDAAELAARLQAIDRARDADARFRVTEFCCTDSTWQATVVELMDLADVVLMDLRGFSADRAGCEFELRQLGARVDLRRVVLVVDQGAALQSVREWLGPGAGRVAWIAAGPGSARIPETLMPALLRASSLEARADS